MRQSASRSTVLVVGVGSPHGDDQLGWLVAKELLERRLDHCVVRIAATPLEILDWIEDCAVLHVVDACHGSKVEGTIYRGDWPAPDIEWEAWSTTHDFNVAGVLALAQQLGQIPESVIVWGIETGSRDRLDNTLSPNALLWSKSLADRIEEELNQDGSST